MSFATKRLFGALVVAASLAFAGSTAAAPGDTELVSAHYAVDQYHDMSLGEVSDDGRYVLFASSSPAFLPADQNREWNVVVRDRLGGTTFPVNRATDGAYGYRLSGDGRYVVFESANAIVAGDTNGESDIYLRDLRSGATERISVSTSGQQYAIDAYDPSVSDDGRYVSFMTDYTTIHVRDRLTRQTIDKVVPALDGGALLSGDGRWLVYRNYSRLVAFDWAAGQSDLVNVSLTGGVANYDCRAHDVSDDGRYVLFLSKATNLVPEPDESRSEQFFLRDRVARTTQRVSLMADGTPYPSWKRQARVSRDGRYVAFSTYTTRTFSGAPVMFDVIRRDLETDTNQLVSVSSAGVEANDRSEDVRMTPDGRFVVFTSQATNLDAGDTDSAIDAYVREFAVPAFEVAPARIRFGGVVVGLSSRSAG